MITIEVALLISGLAFAFAVYVGITNLGRQRRMDDKSEAAQLTTVIVKLENIILGISELKSEICDVREDAREARDRLILVEAVAASAHRRLDLCANCPKWATRREETKQ